MQAELAEEGFSHILAARGECEGQEEKLESDNELERNKSEPRCKPSLPKKASPRYWQQELNVEAKKKKLESDNELERK
jgi:hypothetical protein